MDRLVYNLKTPASREVQEFRSGQAGRERPEARRQPAGVLPSAGKGGRGAQGLQDRPDLPACAAAARLPAPLTVAAAPRRRLPATASRARRALPCPVRADPSPPPRLPSGRPPALRFPDARPRGLGLLSALARPRPAPAGTVRAPGKVRRRGLPRTCPSPRRAPLAAPDCSPRSQRPGEGPFRLQWQLAPLGCPCSSGNRASLAGQARPWQQSAPRWRG